VRCKTLTGLLVAGAAALLLAALPAALPAGPPPHSSANLNPRVLPPHSRAFGKTYGQWSEAWWKWVLSIPADQNPILDSSGAFDGVGQRGPVWFLPVTGAFGGEKERTSAVPHGKAILVPLGIYFNDYPCGPGFEPAPGQSLEEFLTVGAAFVVDHVTALTADVDGVPVSKPFDYRAVSDLFTFTGDPSMAVLDPCITGGEQVGVADGYWLLLHPLRKGPHTIHWSVRIQIPDWGLDLTEHTTFHLTVE
jgi:hypothetical protein